MEQFIEIGKIVKTIGLKGELKVIADKNNTQRILNSSKVFIEGYNNAFTIAKVRNAGNNLAIKFVDYDSIEQVEQFRGKSIFLDAENDFELLPDEYYIEDLIGSVIEIKGQVATIVDVNNYGAGDILTFEFNGQEMQIPFITDFFDVIDVQNKRLVASEHFFEGAI